MAEVPEEPEEVPENLCRLLLKQFEEAYWSTGRDKPRFEVATPPSLQDLISAEYRPKSFLRRRAPDEIETALTQLDQGALNMVKQSFKKNLDLADFAKAIVSTGTYDADRVLAFVSGVVDLYLEVFRSQSDNDEKAVKWAQLMNHFIESPEIVMFEGSEVASAIVGPKSASSNNLAQVRRSNLVDCAKHMGSGIRKINWMPSLEMLTTVEGTESVYFWSPSMAWDTARVVTPQLPADYFDEQKPLWTVHAVAWDNDLQDLVALLSNRFLIFWRLRNREKGQFQQKKEFRFHATRQEGKTGTFPWKVHLRTMDHKNEAQQEEVVRSKVKEPTETVLGLKEKATVRPKDPQVTMRKEKREARLAAEAAQQLDIWWNASMKVWVTADYEGRLYLWDLREHTIESTIYPMKVLQAHSQVVTSFLELGAFKFTTCSLDRSVCLWDSRNLSGAEVKLEEHTGSVLSQAYLPLFSSLVTVGCEKRVFVWSIDSTAYRGVRAKLSAHQANLAQVSTGQRVFVTLDEACIFILWDGATLQALQTTKCPNLAPKHVVVLPSLGRIVLASRRLNFFDGNEQGSIALGAAPSKEQLALAKRREEGASLKDRAAPRWCGLSPSRGVLLSATEAEVRLHGRICPSQSKAIFNAPEGDSISAFAACDAQSFSVMGTAKGAVYFLKYRSGFTLREYHRRREDMDEWAGGGAPAAFSDLALEGGTSGGERSPPASRSAKRGPESPSAGAEPRGLPQTSPSAEDFQRGLSAGITCVLPEEEQKRVYVGTVEGRVIIFSTENDFSVIRWIHLEDATPVTCLDVAVWAQGVEVPDGEVPGLLAVGTQDGMAHIYSLANGRLAGTVNIPKALPEGDSHHALRHIRMVRFAADPALPVTLMTIDRRSRMRFWGFKVHVQSGRLEALKLLLDAGQLRESDCIPAEWLSRLKEKRETEARIRKKKREEEQAKAAKARAAKEGEQAAGNPKSEAAEEEEAKPPEDDGGEGEGENLAAEARWSSKEPVRICAFAPLPPVPVQLPIDCLDKQPFEGPVASAASAVEEMKNSPAYQAKMKKVQENQNSVFLTQPSSGVTAAKYLVEKEEEPVEEFSGSDTDGDAEEIVAKRFAEMPRLPASAPNALMEGDSAAAEALRSAKAAVQADLGAVGQGDSLVFIADTGGWLWCLDIATTLATALSGSTPMAVALDEKMAAQVREELAKDRGEKRSKRPRGNNPPLTDSNRPSIAPGSPTGNSSLSEGSQIGMLVGLPPKARPEVVCVVGAWPAHVPAIASLVIAGSPPALVSVDMNKEVKVWSTAGDIWGHFSSRCGKATAVWPPPHVLAAQMSLISIAKGLCRRMGFHISKQEKLAAQRATPKRSAQRGLTAAERREQIAARRREKQRQVAQQNAEKEALVVEAQQAPDQELGVREDVSSAQDSTGGIGVEEELLDTESLAAKVPEVVEAEAVEAEAVEAEEGEQGEQPEEDRPPLEEVPEETPVEAAPVRETDARGSGPRRAFTSQQMREMIRGNAFSSGFQSYKQFASRPKPKDEGDPTRRSTKVQDFETQRQRFFGRSPKAFGVELATRSEKEAWQENVKTMPRRADSEGALLRYAQSRVEDMTRSVKKSLGVDVTTTTRRRMRKPSFVSNLDIGHVSQDPGNPNSATGQAVRRLVGSRSAGLLNAGNQVMSSSGPRGARMDQAS